MNPEPASCPCLECEIQDKVPAISDHDIAVIRSRCGFYRGRQTFPEENLPELKVLLQTKEYWFYDCLLCGPGSGHVMRRSRDYKFSPLYCHVLDKVLLIEPTNIVATIHDEELKFRELLVKFKDKLPEKLSAEEAFIWITARGCPREYVEDRLVSVETSKLELLLEQHQEKSRAGSTFSKAIFKA